MDQTIEQLEKSIRDMSFAYYEGKPIVSDYVFDQFLRELKLKDPDNIILDMVGLGYKVIGDKRLHGIVTGGLEKINEKDSRYQNYKNLLVTPKYDGLSVTLYYKLGVLVDALTRGGDSGFGKPIIHNIINAAKKFSLFNVDSTIKAISCEVIVELLKFKECLSFEYELPRSAAAGIAQTKSVSIYNEYLSLMPYRIYYHDGTELAITDEASQLLFSKVADVPFTTWKKSPKELEVWVNSLDYPQDGVVLGDAVALKFDTEVVETTVLNIERNISKLGHLIPVLNFKPVRLYGTTVSRCTLVNEGWVELHKVGPGSQIKVTKANQIIPQFIENLTPVDYVSPVECSACGGPVRREGDHLLCVNSCGSERSRILAFLFTHAPLLGYSEAIIDKILDLRRVETFDQLIDRLGNLSTKGFTYHERIYIEYLNKTFSDNLFIQDLLKSLNLPGVGDAWSEKLSHHVINHVKKFKHLPSTVNCNVVESIDRNRDLILKVYDRFGWRDKVDTSKEKMPVTITGKLSMTKDEFCNKYNLKQVTINNSKLLIYANGESTSMKMTNAKKIGAQLFSEDEFVKKFF